MPPPIIDPDFTAAVESDRAGQWVEASQHCRRVLAKNPDHCGALMLMGNLARRAGQFDLALQLLRQANTLEAHIYLGDLLIELERFAEAEVVLRQFIAGYATSPLGWTHLGNLLRVTGRMDEALAAYQQAIFVDPHFAAAHSNLGNLLKDLGKIDEAIVEFRRAVELDPSSAQMHSNLVYATQFSTEYDASMLLEEARCWADRHESPLTDPHDFDRQNPKLIIGYVSGDFRNHVVGRNVLPVLEHHDRTCFEIHCFSTLARHDALTPRFIAAADHWHECAAMDDAMLAKYIRGHRIDILVDLTLHMSGNRLKTFALKPAPIQVTWAGYPGTTGLRSIDYRITDPYLDPPGMTDEFYSEKLLRLPHSFWCYRPMEGVPEVNACPADSSGFVTFGCLNHFGKVTTATLDLWAGILTKIPKSRLLLLCPQGHRRKEILGQFGCKGIEKSRIDFVGLAPLPIHMSRYHQIDIALDPMPYTGHTTTLDSLWMGVPVITLSGATCAARGSVTALRNLRLDEWIAFTPEEYVALAIGFASQISTVSKLRHELRSRMKASPLCNEAQFTQNLEIAYRSIVALA